MVTLALFVQEVLLSKVFVQIQIILAAIFFPVQAMFQLRARTAEETPTAGDVITRSDFLMMKPQVQKKEKSTQAKRLLTVSPAALLQKSPASAGKFPRLSSVQAETAAQASSERPTQGRRSKVANQAVAPTVDKEADFQRRVSASHQALVALGQAAGPEAERTLREFAELCTNAQAAERMLAEAAVKAPPAESDASRWHDVAQTTLRWSLDEVRKRKRALEVRLTELADQVVPPPAHAPLQNAPAVVASPASLQDRSLRRDLESLRRKDPACVLIVRRIKGLGWNSAGILGEYLGRFGQVAEVLICHSMTKPNPKRPAGRSRPAALGFVVMGNPAAASAVLENGMEHIANGVTFEVKAFDAFESDNALETASGCDE